MPAYFLTDPVRTTTYQSSLDQMGVFVMPGTHWVVEGTGAIDLTGSNTTVQVFGAVSTNWDTVGLGSLFALRMNLTLLVGPDGVVSTSAKDFAAATLAGTSMRVVNDGLIFGTEYALYLETAAATTPGTSHILNTGQILGATNAVTTSGRSMIDALRIDNAGLIRSAVDAIALTSATGAITLVNTGSIIGEVRLGAGADLFVGRTGTVDGTVYMDSGNDTARPGLEAETLDGGAGTDTLDFRGRAGVHVSLSNDIGGTGAAAGDLYLSFENVTGSRGNDTIVGSTGSNVLRGEGGADSITGGAGNDTLVGGGGKDTMNGGAGNDTFQWNASTEGGDTISEFSNSVGNDDRLMFLGTGFAGLSAGPLAGGAYIVRPDNVAQQADDRFVFRTTDRTLWFDGDGNGAGAAILIATFGGAVVPTFADFVVF